MPRQILAMASCRVSSDEQLENNSLNRQRQAVINSAEQLGATIPDDGWWSGSVSSKRGTNLQRKDLNEMIEYCKKDKRIKYLIVDEPDRFMRSIDEAAYFEVLFRELGVTVWYASDPELNKGNLSAKLIKFTKYLSAEGSNEERQRKSINGQTAALKEGRYTFHPKAGYKRGYERGIPEIHEISGPPLRTVLKRIAARLVTPTDALKELNVSDFTKVHAPIKMDKFRKIVTDPFYAGILEINKQVKVRNENGLHESLISKDEHLELINIMNNKLKTQSGPRKNGNPKYPLNNIVHCELCKNERYGRYVGYNHGNGKNPNLVYEKYRCRNCARYITRDDMHRKISELLGRFEITSESKQTLLDALEIAWKENENSNIQQINRISHKVKSLRDALSNQVEAITLPENAFIREEIRQSIGNKKTEIALLDNSLYELKQESDFNKRDFLEFALNFIDDLDTNFFELSKEERVECKQLVFPEGFYLSADNKVYTPNLSIIYRLATKKKDAEASVNSHLVRVKRL